MERLDKHFKRLTRAVFERHGFAYGEALTQWDAIVGERLAQHTRPLKVKWPRQHSSPQKLGGVLTVQAAPGFALELHYETPRLIERINSYFGYGAISAVRIVPGNPARHSRSLKAAAAVPPGEAAAIKERLAGIAEGGLKEALARLGAGVKSRSSA
jgi:hypothetical protein